MARRRHRRRGRPVEPRTRLIVIGTAAIVLVGAFVFLVNRGDNVEPAREEASIELPDAFAD